MKCLLFILLISACAGHTDGDHLWTCECWNAAPDTEPDPYAKSSTPFSSPLFTTPKPTPPPTSEYTWALVRRGVGGGVSSPARGVSTTPSQWPISGIQP